MLIEHTKTGATAFWADTAVSEGKSFWSVVTEVLGGKPFPDG